MPLFPHFRGVAKEHDASMTFFLSGLYLLPKSKRTLYWPPGGRPAGSSAIPSSPTMPSTPPSRDRRGLEGGPRDRHPLQRPLLRPAGGVGDWSAAEWKSEIDQAKSFVRTGGPTPASPTCRPLPFDYDKELVGGRAPCLEGQNNLLHDRRDAGLALRRQLARRLPDLAVEERALWDFPLQLIPFPGHTLQVLSMDYNFLSNQSRRRPTATRPSTRSGASRPRDRTSPASDRAYDGNRAPLFIGNHFEAWNGGIYMQAVETVMRKIATYPDARIVSFRQLCGYLDAQDPQMLRALRTLPIGTAPSGGWKAFSPAAT